MATTTLSIVAFTSSILLILTPRSKKLRHFVNYSILRGRTDCSVGPFYGCSESKNGSITAPTTKEQVLALREKHFVKNVSLSYANSGPLMIVGGEGSRLMDESGRSYLDTRNNVAHVGHGHPRVVQAIQEQVQRLNTNTRYLHPNNVELARRLVEKLPEPLHKVIFVNSGSEANDLALRLARAYTRSKNTIVVDGAYHGHTLAVLEVSPYKYEHSQEFSLTQNGTYETPGNHIWKVPCPDIYRGEHRGADAGTKYAAYVEEACQYYKDHGERVGAFIIEGGMSVAGVILPPEEYLQKSVAAVRAAGGVYIADEVQTGFGRLGSSYWAFEYGGRRLVPDIVTVGKPFGNGIPLAAVITNPHVAETFENMNVEYFATFAGNPVSAAAGLAVLDVMEEEGLQQHALKVGTYMLDRFRDLQSRLDIIGDVRGSGLFIGVELVRDQVTKEPATAETSFICTQLKQKYLILSSIDGLHENVLVIKPPLVFSMKDVDNFVDSFIKAVDDLRILGHGIMRMVKTPT